MYLNKLYGMRFQYYQAICLRIRKNTVVNYCISKINHSYNNLGTTFMKKLVMYFIVNYTYEIHLVSKFFII